MVGTPVICSDACGSAEVVEQSGVGGVFLSNDANSLKALLENALECGIVTADKRSTHCSSGNVTWRSRAGATYLQNILAHVQTKEGARPQKPWCAQSSARSLTILCFWIIIFLAIKPVDPLER